ncbi:RICIN domain-containing protein [Streptomyces sp. NBC_01275]|uniref:RICIN domain-containing protein n=1 Tax=Streptomyces sp. NBC_01275 TaxID=2903807 RepID=UPI002254DAA1|nr:RICIN domain-containing protein [Streptomyces sp. NBC_01275]MCX4762344.1 RICIN domain-containing protein [Streptomyces sp. NBC_01275]
MYEHLAQQALHDPRSVSGTLPEHAPAVRAYAEAFCVEPRDATDLAGHVLARGSQSEGPALRTALLADVRRTADSWLRDGRSGLLHPEFRAWSKRAADAFGPTDTLRRAERSSVFLAAFEQLADQSRAALWLCLAEAESASAARILNTSEEFAESLAQSARSRLVDTFLRVRADRTADPCCVRYGGMLGAIARGTHREAPADLGQHLDACRFCAHDLRLLRTLASGDAQEVRRLLVDQVLVWGGAAYRKARPADQAPAVESGTPPGPAGDVRRGRPEDGEDRRRRRPVFLVAVTVVVTAVLTTAVLRLLSGSDSAEGAERPGAGASASAAPAPEGSVSPSPEESASASPSASPTTGASTGTITLESVSTGRCVTGPAADASSGPGPALAPDPVLAACDGDGGGEAQQWRVVRLEKGAVALVNVASKLCLDIAGDRVEGDGMQQRPCAYERGADAPFPEDQAFLPRSVDGDSFALICQDNPEIALGVRSGEPAMRTTGAYGKAVRFALDDGEADALGL